MNEQNSVALGTSQAGALQRSLVRAFIAAGLVGAAASITVAQSESEQPDTGIEPPPELIELEAPQPEVSGEDDAGFPSVPDSPDVPDAAIDGPAFPVSSFTLTYIMEHPSLPPIEELMNVTVELVQTPEGFIGPRPGLPTVRMTIHDLSDGQTRQMYTSAIRAVGRALVDEFARRNLVGVRIDADPDQIDRGRDYRDEGDTGLTLIIFNVVASELHTIASGGRIPVEDRLDNPKHARILSNSPIVPYQPGSDEPRRDLIRRDLLDEYAIRLSRHPGRRVDVAVARGAGPGQAEVQYLVQESKPWTVYFQLANTGTQSTEEWRERFGFVHNQLTNRDDILSIEYITAGFDASHALVGSYEARLAGADRWRWRVTGSWNEFDASEVGVLNETFTGEGWTLGGDLIWNVYQKGNYFLDLVGGVRYEHIEVSNVTLGGGSNGEDDLFMPHIGVQAERVSETSSIFGSLNLEWTVSGISGANASSLEELGRLAPDEDWYTLQWDTQVSVYLEPLLNYEAWSDPSTPESSTLAHELFLSFRGQYAFEHRLIPNAEQVLGGLYTVRGYDESSVAGDTTWVGTIEYRFHLPRALAIDPDPQHQLFGRDFKVRPQQVYGRPDWDLVFKAFLDVGQAYNSDRRVFEKDETLVGAGLGIDLSIMRNVTFRTDWGVVLDEVSNGQQDVGDNRFHIVLTILF
ncbi:MAG: ShlB/FhaC/HecB family hemolysin secretion/activation protein [Planctomycetota bacterium]|nr:MAG: ShlB/FhaC/HecB family hemolysin secretion/activation protein [Planctomycetota bacterium]